MKATLFALFVALLMVGCEQEGQSVGSEGDVEDKPFLPSLPSFNLNESEFERTKRLAEGGDKVAQHNLGVMYDTGKGVSEDDKEAIKWYTKSAEQGLAMAQAMVGVFYADGLGVAKNPIEGYAWYNIAIANGQEDAKEWIKEIELSSEQLIEAQSLSTEIYKRIEANKKD
jgi:hypothetical protein